MTPTNQHTFHCWFCYHPLTPKLVAGPYQYDWICLPCAHNNNLEEVEFTTIQTARHATTYRLQYVNFNIQFNSKTWYVNLSEEHTSVALLDDGINWIWYNLPGQILTPKNVKTRLPTMLTFS